MKKFLSGICFCLLLMVANAQDDPANRKYIDQATGSLLYLFQTVDVQGSQFLSDKWTNAKVIASNGASLNNLELKFDVYNNKFVLNRNDTSYEVSPVVTEVRLYPFPDTSAVMVFKKGYSINDRINAKMYVQVFAEGKIGFYKYAKKDLEEYTEYGNANKLKRFNDIAQYYILVNGQYRSTSLSKKNLQDVLGDKWAAVSDYMGKNNLNGKDERSWQLAIRYYNTL